MKRFLEWLLGKTGNGTRARVAVIDLPEEWGARMSVGEVHALFLDPKHKEVICALVQVLWMNRTAAQKRALDAGACGAAPGGSGSAATVMAFALGEIENVNNALADVQLLMAEGLRDERGNRMEWAATDRMKAWFREDALKS